MIRDIYSRDALAPKFNDNTLEVSDTLSQLIIKNTPLMLLFRYRK